MRRMLVMVAMQLANLAFCLPARLSNCLANLCHSHCLCGGDRGFLLLFCFCRCFPLESLAFCLPA